MSRNKEVDSQDVGVPEDFVGAKSEALRRLDQSTRCGICSDVFVSPVLLSNCCHSFCSKCIRIHLAQAGSNPKCPACGTAMSEHSIKPNKTLEEIGLAWSQARSVVLALAQAQHRSKDRSNASSSSTSQPKSKKRKTKHSSNSDDSDLEVMANKNADDQTPPANLMVTCPLCSSKMKNSLINAHLNNNCASSSGASDPKWKALGFAGGSSSSKSKPLPKKMNPISAKMPLEGLRDKLKDTGLYDLQSKKDRELSKDALAWRYNHFVTLYNSNKDASEANQQDIPTLKKQLRADEKLQSSSAATAASAAASSSSTSAGGSAGSGHIDLKAHAKKYKDEFAELIQQARASLNKKKAQSGEKPEDQEGQVTPRETSRTPIVLDDDEDSNDG